VRRLTAPLALAVLLSVPAEAGDGTPPAAGEDVVPFAAAVATRRIDAESLDAYECQRVRLKVTNRGAAPVAVDLCGGVLVPEVARACSRLALGPAVLSDTARSPRPGQVVVDLAAGEAKTVLMHTCCLDARVPYPRAQRLRGSGEPLRPPASSLLAWWAAHPAVPQAAVNAAIWTRRESVVLDARYGTAALAWGRGRVPASTMAAHGGTVFQLVEGRLTSLDDVRERRVLGSEVVQVLPEADALYAVFPLSSWQAELRRLAYDGDEPAWELVARITEDQRLSRVLALESGSTLLATAEGILRVDPGSADPERVLPTAGPCGLRIDARGEITLLITRWRAGQAPLAVTYRYDADTNRTLHAQEWERLRSVRLGRAGLFGLNGTGRLVRIERGKEVLVGDLPALHSILAVGRHVVWLRGPDALPFAVDPNTGREVSRPASARGVRDADLSLDAATGDLVGLDRGTWFRWRSKNGVVEPLHGP
jgi:hypothetical protein